MPTIRISATKARNNFFELLNQVASGMEVVIEKDNKEVATLTAKTETMDWEGIRKASKATHGIFKNLSVEEISPLRKKGRWSRLGKWDQ